MKTFCNTLLLIGLLFVMCEDAIIINFLGLGFWWISYYLDDGSLFIKQHYNFKNNFNLKGNKMNKEKINNLINDGYYPKVYLSSDKKYTKMILKTILEKKESNIVYPIYYNHIKKILNNNQIAFINNYNLAKNLRFSKIVDLNIKSKNNELNRKDMELLIMYKAIKNMEYLEQI